ncbi:MAG: nucleotidyl transferase AbiEii/AbiGii toxin family protein [Bacilli bacterium]
MRLHENEKLFKNIVELTALKENISSEIIEKDYYVILALKKLYEYDSNIVFVGGTALAKCFNIIKRFSEDIDLSVKHDSKKGAQKQTHKIIENIKTNWAWNIEDENKIFQDFKVIFLNYSMDNTKNDFKVEKRIRLELLTFLNPFPIVEKKISPYVMKYLTDAELEEYDIKEIIVKTQEPYRTLFEKILLQKELYQGFLDNNEERDDQIRRARDFYDIHKIWEYYNKRFPFTKEQMLEMLESRNLNRKNRLKIDLNNLSKNKLYDMYIKRNIKKQLEVNDKTKLTIRDLDCDSIEKSLKEIDIVLSQYNK